MGGTPIENGNWSWSNTLDRVAVRVGKALGVYTRGMLSELTVALGEWYAVAERPLNRWPIESFTASDVAGLSLGIRTPTRESADWQLVGSLKVTRRRMTPRGVRTCER